MKVFPAVFILNLLVTSLGRPNPNIYDNPKRIDLAKLLGMGSSTAATTASKTVAQSSTTTQQTPSTTSTTTPQQTTASSTTVATTVSTTTTTTTTTTQQPTTTSTFTTTVQPSSTTTTQQTTTSTTSSATPSSTPGAKTALIYQAPNIPEDQAMIRHTGEMLEQGGWTVTFTSSSVASQLSQYTMFVCPGSNRGSSFFINLFSQSDRQAIQDYVTGGGRYLGICMGAYAAGPFGIFQGVAGGIRGAGPGIEDILYNGSTRQMYTEDSPNLGQLSAVPGQRVIHSTFVSDGAANSIIEKFGSGFVGLVAGHPEANQYWTNMSPATVSRDIGVDLANQVLNGF